MPDWKVENLRVTMFARGSQEPLEELWSSITGEPPERINQRPKDGRTTAEGIFEGAKLILSRDPIRTDLLWVVDIEAMSSTEMPSIGPFADVPQRFLRVVSPWLNRHIPIKRLAWGGVLLLPATDKEDGYRKLSRFLPSVTIDPRGSSDFSYQINRARPSRIVDGVSVNRLSIWSVGLRQVLATQLVVSGNGANEATSQVGPSLWACRVQFDINSDAARRDPLPENNLVPLLNEFVDLSAEIAEHGDVP